MKEPEEAGTWNGLRPPEGWLISADSVATLYSFPKTVLSHPRMSGPYPRAVVTVGFQPVATLDERRSAIEGIRGRIIGGMGLDYVVVIDDDGTGDRLWAAVDALCRLPQVHHAGPDLFTLGAVPAAE